MNDHDTAREQLIDAIMDSADQRHMEDEAGQWDYFNCIEFDDTADAVIAHLWRMADDPEVVGAVIDVIEEATGYHEDEFARDAITATLTALLGPRPTEQEATDE